MQVFFNLIYFFPGRTFFQCKYCGPKNFSCANDGKTALKKHEATTKHKNAIKEVGKSLNVFDMCKKRSDTKSRAQKIELQVTMLIVKKNLPLSISDEISLTW